MGTDVQTLCDRTIAHFARKADHNKQESLVLFTVIIAATLTAPLFVTLGDGAFWGKGVPSVLSLLAAAGTTWLQLRKPQQLWSLYRTAQRELEDSLLRFHHHLAPFDADSNPEKLLAKHVAKLKMSVHQHWSALVPDASSLPNIASSASGQPIATSAVPPVEPKQ
jgi:hypothetical protein